VTRERLKNSGFFTDFAKIHQGLWPVKEAQLLRPVWVNWSTAYASSISGQASRKQRGLGYYARCTHNFPISLAARGF